MRLGVGDLAPQFVPDLGQGVAIVAVLDGGRHDASTALGARLHPLELPKLLHRPLEDVGYLVGDLLSRGPRIIGDNEGVFDGELWILKARKIQVRPSPGPPSKW